MIDSDGSELIDSPASEARLRAMAWQMNEARGVKDEQAGWAFFDLMAWSANRLGPADQQRLRSMMREIDPEPPQISIEESVLMEHSERMEMGKLDGSFGLAK